MVIEGQRRPNITPVFKKDKKENLGKNTLISLTSISRKVMEGIFL